MNRRVAIISFYEAYPPASGAASVSYNLAKFLSGSSVLVQLGRHDGRFVTADGVEVVTLAGASESRPQRLGRLPGFVNRMVAEIRRAAPDVVILEGASWAFYHWMLLRRIRRAIPQTKVVYHSHNVEYLLRSMRNGRAVALLTRVAERRVVRDADLVTAVSQVDQSHFARLYGVKPILLPNGVDTKRFAPLDRQTIASLRAKYGIDSRTLLFAGFYAYGPNREAIDFLVTSVMPALRHSHPSATLALTGGGAPYHEPWIRNAGSIPYDDFAGFVGACGVAVAPIFSGSGTRLKILEAMAAGIPVVATEKAAEGLSLKHGEDILFARDGDEFVRRISELFDSPDFVARLCERGRLKAASKFSWDGIARKFEDDILMAGGTPDQGACPQATRAAEFNR
ncbi:glycosyltransferase family 4 protein [Candidatus Binatus sp.]|uniref:glycosyltransferase family 4 protein n=1 Tax=Candidatus Binatus sp. TaxID=2811406 RepID=UPI003BDBC385